MRSPAALHSAGFRSTCHHKLASLSVEGRKGRQILATLASGGEQAQASADPGPASLQPPAEPSAMLQQDPRSTDGVFQTPEDAPALRDEKCDGKGTCEGAPGTEQPALPPKKKRRSRMQELQEARTELQAKEQELRKKSSELQALSSEKDQTIAILQDELDIERTLRSLLERDKEKAEEIAALAMNLCSGVTIPP